MNPIALGQPAAYQPNPWHTPSGASASAPGGAPVDDLRAENNALASSVGALGAYAAHFSAAPVAPVAPSDPATMPQPSALMPPLQASTGSTGAPFAPARSWSSMVGQNGPGGTPAGSVADQGLSQILDGGDVFDTSDD